MSYLPLITRRTLCSSRRLAQQLISKEDQLLNSIPSKSKEIQERISNLQNKTLNLKQRQLEELERMLLEDSKPKLSDFQIPIFNTLVLASTVYLLLQWCYTYLEKEEILKEYQIQVKDLEVDIQLLLDARDLKELNRKGWFGWLWA